MAASTATQSNFFGECDHASSRHTWCKWSFLIHHPPSRNTAESCKVWLYHGMTSQIRLYRVLNRISIGKNHVLLHPLMLSLLRYQMLFKRTTAWRTRKSRPWCVRGGTRAQYRVAGCQLRHRNADVKRSCSGGSKAFIRDRTHAAGT